MARYSAGVCPAKAWWGPEGVGETPRLGRALPWQAVRVLALDVPRRQTRPGPATPRRGSFPLTVSPPDRERLANLLNMRAANL